MNKIKTQLTTLLFALFMLCLFSLPSYAKQSQQDIDIINNSSDVKLIYDILNPNNITLNEGEFPKIRVNRVTNKRSTQKIPFHKSAYRIENFNVIKQESSSSKEFPISAFQNTIIVNKEGKITHIDLTLVQIKKIGLIDKLSKFSHLKGLSIKYSEIAGKKLLLENFDTLEDLYLMELNISEIILPINSKLITLKSVSSPLSRILNLEKQSNLKHLKLSLTKLQEIDDLKFSKQLLTLDLGDSYFKEIPSLNNFPNLRYLDFTYASIEDIQGVGQSKNLLFLKTNGKLKDVITDFPDSLTSLTLSGDNYVEMPNIGNLNNLEYLTIYGTKINKITNLENLMKLERLSLSTNNIQKIEGLDKLTNLQRLDLSNCKIERIEGLDALGKLVKLDLSMNKITKVESLDHLNNIEYIKLEKNPIEQYDPQIVDKIISHAKVSLRNTPFYDNLKKSNKEELKRLRRKGAI